MSLLERRLGLCLGAQAQNKRMVDWLGLVHNSGSVLCDITCKETLHVRVNGQHFREMKTYCWGEAKRRQKSLFITGAKKPLAKFKL